VVYGAFGIGQIDPGHAVEEKLFEHGCSSYVLDGDNIRHGLNKNLGYSPEDRTENIRRIGEVSKLFVDAAVFALTAFISPYRADREQVRQLAPDRFVEIYCHCSLDVCEQRDPKGLYKKARAGQIPEFTGISAPYEEPLKPELVVHTDQESLEESTEKVLTFLRKQGMIQ
jgi:adenylylsulfate kinase